MDKIAVVILNWNGCDMLRSFLPSVVAFFGGGWCCGVMWQTMALRWPPWQCSVVSFFCALDSAGREPRFCRRIQSGIEAGGGRICSAAQLRCRGHRALACPVGEYMDAYPETAACQPKIRSWRNKGQFEYAGAAGGFIDRYGYPFCRGRIMGVVEEDKGQYDTVIPIFWATGAALFIRLQTTGKRVGWTDVFLPTWRDRFMLAASCPWQTVGMYTAECGISCGRGHFEEGESAQDLPQFS